MKHFLVVAAAAAVVLCHQIWGASVPRHRYVQGFEPGTFVRDAVERRPDYSSDALNRAAPYGALALYSKGSLPLRSAIEKVPSEVYRRLPLRDAVEVQPDHETEIPFWPRPTVRRLVFDEIIDQYRPRKSRAVRNIFHYRIDQSPVVVQTEETSSNRIVCYLEGTAVYRRQPNSFGISDLDPDACTHVIYAYATVDPHSYAVASVDHEYDEIKGGYRAAVGLKRHNPNLKVLISIGGESTKRFSNLVASSLKRKTFIRSVIDFLEKHEFDGIDISWHYPGSEEHGGVSGDKENFDVLLEELYEILKARNWLLTVTAPGSRFKVEDGFLPTKLGEKVDFVNLQAFDFHFEKDGVADNPAPLYKRDSDMGMDVFFNVDYAVRYWLRQGLPRSKLVVGLPFFGRSFTLASPHNMSSVIAPGHEGYYTQTPGMLAYFELCGLDGWTKGEDSSGSPHLAFGNQWVGYDDVESISKKVAYVKQMGLGGVYIWAIDMDDFKGLCGDKWPLLSSVRKSVQSGSSPPAIQPSGMCPTDGLFNDPNDCSAYYLCRGGLNYHLACGNGMFFNVRSGICERGSKYHNCQIEINKIEQQQKLSSTRAKMDRKVVCYMTNWSFYRKGEGKFVPEHLDSQLCTHTVYAFASLEPESLMIKEFDPWADIENNLYERMTSMKDVKPLLAIGGWTDSAGDKYSRLVSDGSARRKFVLGAVAFLRKHGFRGLHIDWNYPKCWQSNCNKGPSSDKPNFTKLIQELRMEFDKQSPSLILAASISGYKEVIDAAYEMKALGDALDFISVMTYDYHGSWEFKTGHVSPLYQRKEDKYAQYNTNYTMEYLVGKGAPRDKLLVGIPFYGQTFALSKQDSNFNEGAAASGPGDAGEYTKQPGMLAYYEICSRVKNRGWILDQGNFNGDLRPRAYFKNQWVGFETVESVKEKAKYIDSSGFGGAALWTVDLDDFSNQCCYGAFPLLRSINREFGLLPENNVIQQGDCTKPPEPVTPPAPVMTTGSDSGASSSTTPHHHHHQEQSTTSWPTWTSESTTTSPWWTPSSTTPSTTTTTTTTTTMRPSTTTTTAAPTPAVVMPPLDDTKPSPTCTTGEYKEDKTDCSAYYRCVLGEFRKELCAGGLHWNKNTRNCDWPMTAQCPFGSLHDDPHSTQSTTTVTTARPTSTTSTKKPTGEQCTNGMYYPHEECEKFNICVNGQFVESSCAPGLQWVPDKNMCDWGFKANCKNRQKLAQSYSFATKNYGSCEASDTYKPHPTECGSYLQCNNNVYIRQTCGAGLHWNNQGKFCDWPENAKCVLKPSHEDTLHDEVVSTTAPMSTTSAPIMATTPMTTTTTMSTPTEKPDPVSGYFKIVCYFTNWAWYRPGIGKYLPEDIDANLCTHIVYGFAVLDYENLIVKAHDSWADFDNNFYQRVVAYKKKGLKVSLALGGWNDSQGDKYSRLVNNPSARARFIKHVLEFLEKYDFDGLDLDWEYPKCWQVDCSKGPDSDKAAFAAWVTELKEAFRPKGYLLSAAVSPSKTVVDAGYDVPTIGQNLDWVAVMTYDFHGQWDKQTGHVAPLYEHPDDEVVYFNADFAIKYWIEKGVPRRKIVMGMPLYGQSFQLERESTNGLNAKAPGPGQAGEFTRAAGFLAYYEICDKVQNHGWTVVKDPKRRMGPYAYKGNQWVSFDDAEMIKLKSEYIRKMDLGGGMIWALDLDDFRNRCGQGRHPLLTVIRDVLRAPGSGTVIGTQPVLAQEDEKPAPTMPPSTGVAVTVPTTISITPSSTTTVQPAINKDSKFKVVCYFTNWAWYRQGMGKYLPSDIDPDLCTHIVYGFAVLDGDQLVIKPHDSWADFDNKFYEKVTALKSRGIKVLIAIGGWNDSAGDKYSRLANSPASRRKFISHVLKFIEDNNFDGLDLDWEYPKCWQVDCNKGPDSDKSAFSALVRELRQEFAPKGLLLSAAVSPSKRVVDAGYDVKVLSENLDWIAVMAYDYHGQWDKITGHVAPMYEHPEDIDVTFNSNFSINYWLDQGASRNKIVMGMPLYGQSFSLAENNVNGLNAATYGGGEAGEYTRARGFLSYYEICSNIQNRGWKVVRDPRGRMGPYAYLRDQWVSFDDVPMIQHKSEYVKAMNLGGAMIWALDLDDFKNNCGCEEYPLLRTINRVLRDYKKPNPNCKLESGGVKATEEKEPTPIINEILPKPTSCQGRLFLSDETDCNKYYLCNQGTPQHQACPNGLHWNKDRCDWPENAQCKESLAGPVPSTTLAPPTTTTELVVTSSPIRPTIPSSTPVMGTMPSKYKVVCYFTNWAWYRQGDGKYTPDDIDPSLCTHIAYGFAVLDSGTLTIKPHDSWADIDNNFYTKVAALRSKGIKVLIAIGGWNDSLGDKYSRLVNDASARSRFITNVIEFIEKYGFDGLDLDWEYPKCWQVDCTKGPDSDKPSFSALVRELKQQFRPKGLLLSAAVSPSKTVIDAGYDVASISSDLDWVAVMAYDFHGHWDKQTGHVAPLYHYPGDKYDHFNANYSINYWLEKGAPASKLVMGMPLYGQSFALAETTESGLNAMSYGPGEAGEYTRAGGFLAFYEICERTRMRGWTVVRDPEGRIGPYAKKGNQWVSYDDIAEIKRKTKMVKDLGLGGAMIWALDLDDFRNRCGCGKHPLLKTINQQLDRIPAEINLVNCT